MEVMTNERLLEFIKSTNQTTQARCLHAIELLVTAGKKLGLPHSKKINSNLWELRIKGDQEVRLLYGFKKNIAHVVHGFVKKSNKTPKKEIDTAQKRLLH